MKPILIDRPPRIQPELPFGEFEIPAPPDKRMDGWMRILQVALPAISIIGFILMSAMGGMGRNPWFMLPMALSVVASIGFAIYTMRQEQAQLAQAARVYESRLLTLTREMEAHHEQQRRFYRHNYPEVSDLFALVERARTDATRSPHGLRAEARLWERRTNDEDFGVVRLGVGTLPSTVIYKVSEGDPFTSDPQLRAAMKLAGDSLFVDNIPVVMSLRKPIGDDETAPDEQEVESEAREQQIKRVPASHTLAIAGERGPVYEYAGALLSHFAVFHLPANTQMLIVAQKRQPWEWFIQLPHCGGNEGNYCFLDDTPDEEEALWLQENEETALSRVLESVRRTLSQRKLQMEEQDENKSGASDAAAAALPFLLLVVDLLDAAYSADSPLRDIESEAALSLLFDAGTTLGAAVIFLTPDRSKVPSRVAAVVEVERTAPPANRDKNQKTLFFRYSEVGVNSVRYLGAADGVERPERLLQLAQDLANSQFRRSFGAELPGAVAFMALMGFGSLRDLQEGTTRHWQESLNRQQVNWLRAKIGMLAGNKPRKLVFSAKRDGVHGIVAGSTGSGKSELLISLIMAMAITYDPSVVNFVLVDYKGGSTFEALRELPHVVDMITNLNADGVTRMFTAINSELRRRQKLNADTGTKHIVEFRQKEYHLRGPNGEPGENYPFLFIIIDEFAEMIADRAEFRAELESITRVGRAQGVHLLLAAQRPTGVTDQMRSNIKYRICLRVETPGESRELLRRPDASFLPGGIPGRGFLQVGNDDVELMQVAYAGDAYVDPAPVIWPDRIRGEVLFSYRETPELYRVMVKLLDKMAREQGRPRQRAPWPAPLPRELTLTQVLVADDDRTPAVTSREYLHEIDAITHGAPAEAILTLNPSVNRWMNQEEGWDETPDWDLYALRPVVGLVDNPYEARQVPLTIDLLRHNVVLVGAANWGKTAFLRTLTVSLAAVYSPQFIHIYLLDLGGRSLAPLNTLPHVGAVINPDEEGYPERVAQLFRDVLEIVEKRKELLAADKAQTLVEYNKRHPEEPEPAILIAIDNFLEFKERFDTGNDEIEDVFDQFVELARHAKVYGIHLIITANSPSVISTQIFNLFSMRLVLKLNDVTEYRTVVQGAPGDLAPIAGRGYVNNGHQALVFQVAQPFDVTALGITEAQALEEFIQNIRDYLQNSGLKYRAPVRIDPLPKGQLLRELLIRTWGMARDAEFLPQLRSHAADYWRESLEPARADWLAVTLGVASGNRPRTLQLEAKRDGVHGLIAGGTGSGKSELLMTLIVALALKYDPSILNFVLVDFKGGGAFAPFRNLPHVVDIITNLNISGVRRMFTAISAETQRRQKLNADTETKDIVEYRKKGFHLRRPDGSPGIPYPHLFIIIDEYAEMIANNPEFKDELDSIARVGRAQGMNLLLAAQRPTGVTDQMRANIKYRICLRVEETDTSREMLRRSDAAFLPNGMPGRGYLQVGNDNIELIQVAWTGDDYTDPPYEEIREGARQPKFFDVVVDTAIELTQGKRPETPWPPPLPNGWLLADPLSISYWGEEQRRQVTLGKRPIDSLNPWVADWLAGRGAWPGLDWSSSALRAVCGLVDDPGNARQLPLLVDLSKGHLVLFGSSGNGKTTFLRTLVASLAATHRPTEFHAHLLDLGGRNLELLEALPHVGSIIMPDERGYEERVQQLLRELGNVVDIRKRLFSAAACTTIFEYNHGNPEKTEPAILVAIDNFSEFLETFGNPAGKDDGNSVFGQFIALARQGKAYGIHFAVTAPRLNALPTPIYSLFTERLTLRLAEQDDYRAIVGAVQSIDEIPGRGYVRVGRDPLEFQIAIAAGDRDEAGQIISEARQIRALGAAMQTAAESLAGGRRPFRIAALPSTSSFREVLTEVLDVTPGDGFVGGLADAIARTWAVTRSAEKADWLEFPLGVTSGNTIRNVHLSAKTDGVHGLIAGGTGSGKSELLMTMIVGLATRYDPTILNFVLVDYKGGGAFKPFEQLPHVVDVVTNLNKAAVYRMFSSISAEIRRRQKLNVDTATKDIVDYRKKGLHLIGEPYPHLVIIIDEYAEMIDDNPEFKSELESITRVGRAQGINLFLASQRPKGVTDQMRANIKLRICLRVEELDTSREMLRRPDAALLPNGMPGRGYLQVGNETIELIQVSYTGERQRDDRSSAILWPERPAPIIDQAASEAPALFEMVVQLTRELTHGKKTLHPWPSFMAPVFSLQSELEDVKLDRRFTLNSAMTEWANGETEGLWPGVAWQSTALRAVVGLVDNPSQASQLPLAFELSRYHLVAYGDSASGKTGLLQTLLLSLAATHSPEELHIYVLDLAGRNFRVHEQLPHMGAVIYADDELFEERLVRLLEKLGRTIEERQRLLAEQGVAGALEYNERNPTQPLPLLLVLIDNFAELIENHEMLVDNTLIPLIRRALPVGISFVTTNGGSSGMVSRVAALFSERITFRQSNTDRYMDIVGRGAVDFGATPGRGYLRMEQKPLLFHIARPIGLYLTESPLDTFVETAELRRVVEAMRTAAQARNLRRPAPIEILADEAPLDALLAEAPAPRLTAIEAVIGRDVRLQPAVVNLRRMGPHFAVAGPPFSGKSTVLYNWVLSLAWRYSPAQVAFLLIDTQRRLVDYGGQHRLSDLPHVWHALQEVDQLAQILPQLQAECAKMAEAPGRPELFIVIDNYDDFGDELDANRVLAGQMAHLARRYGRDGLHFIIAGSLEGAGNDLRRRVQSSNFGLGLRTGNSLDALRVNKRPAGLQDKEMVVGRGYLVKSGQTTLLQSASPWGQNGQGGEGEEESRNAAALDGWVERIVARWPGQFSALQTTASSEAAAGPGSGPVESGLDQQSAEYLEILRRAQAKQDGAGQALVAHWGPREILFSLVKEAVQRELAHDTSGMAASLQTEEDFLLQTEWLFPALENPADTTGTPSTNGDA